MPLSKLLVSVSLVLAVAACATNRKSNRGTEVVDAAPTAPQAEPPDRDRVGATPDPLAILRERVAALGPVYFDFDSALLSEDARRALASLAQDWPEGGSVLVSGHADERGTAAYNVALGQRRAEAIRAYLVRLGVPDGSVRIVSFGSERPAVEGHSEAAWAKNRRAELDPDSAALGAR